MIPYVTALGAWGDIFACCSHISALTKNTKFKKVNVLYYGSDPSIKEFLEYQDNVLEVIHACPKPKEDSSEKVTPQLNSEYEATLQRSHGVELDWIEEIFPVKLSEIQVIPTHVTWQILKTTRDIIRGFDYRVPPIDVEIKPHTLLLNPYSFQSCSFQNHWVHIPEVAAFLANKTDWNIVLIGQERTLCPFYNEYWDFPLEVDHPKVLNLVGKTKSMVEVLSIAEKCEAIVTTSNCLSLWSIISNKPALIMMNAKLTTPAVIGHVYYQEWVKHPPNTLVDCGHNFEDFLKIYEDWISMPN